MKKRKKCPHDNPPRVKNGSGYACVICKRERERNYYHTVYKSRKIALAVAYARAHPEKQKTPEALEYSRAWLRARRKEYPERYRRYEKTKRERHGDKLKQSLKEWRHKNRARVTAKERARRAGISDHLGITQAEWDAIIAIQHGRCDRCGLKKKLTMDHIDPVSKGGAHAPYNLQGLCGLCNSLKGNRIEPGTQICLILGRPGQPGDKPNQSKKPGGKRSRKAAGVAG